MDFHIKEFYKESSHGLNGNFHKVFLISDSTDSTWEDLHEKIPLLTKGWYELAQLSSQDRIEFTKEFWLSMFPYHPGLQDFIENFFNSLDDIVIFITQKKYDDAFEPQMVYSIANNGGFFRGCSPAIEDDVTEMERNFADYIFPQDYLAFLKIHNGFCKATDSTGIFKTKEVSKNYRSFQEMIDSIDTRVTTERGLEVNPRTLIPFYESFGMPFYQCFWGDWYPQNVTGMGNVYFSVTSKTISDPLNYENSSSLNMAYTTFTDWLLFYLERIE